MVAKTFADKLMHVWTGWEIRVLVLVSLLLQVILVVFGSRRKLTTRIWIRIIVWAAYMSADWVATVALGNLATLGGYCGQKCLKPNDLLQSFWAPFLLLHLGGPDTITAYALEDNELWLRHLLGLIVEVGVAFYVFSRSGGDTTLTFIAIPVFIAGIIKYGERTWVLRSSSAKHFRSSLLSAPDAGPDYVEFVENRDGNDRDPVALTVLPHEDVKSNDYLHQAGYLFKRFKYLFADLILGYYERTDCHSIISNKSPEEAFQLVEVELSFLYDLLYTKANFVYSWFGILLRVISFLASVSALVTFSILIFFKQNGYSTADITITYILLFGAVVLEVYALVILTYSDWTMLFLTRFGMGPSKQPTNVKRWPRIISQYNIMDVCLREAITPRWIGFQKSLGIYEISEKMMNVTWQGVVPELKDLIFQQLKEKSKRIEDNLYDINLCKTLLTHRGDHVLKEIKCDKHLEWSTVGVEFDHSLLLWHIATELCYYDDLTRFNHPSITKSSKISKCLSDYMLYLLVMCPNMLPKGIGEIRYRDTCEEAVRFFKRKKEVIKNHIGKACYELLRVKTEISLEEVKGDRCKSVLFYGNRLGKQLQALKPEDQSNWGCDEKWEMINKVWVELLAYAAVHCGWKEHAQQLRRGGELLTHVCLLMAHLGLSDQYQIQKQFIHQPNRQFFEALFLKAYKKPRSECFLCSLRCLLCISDRSCCCNKDSS
ncbi:uncharacterized protein LOC105798145 [Gossypium raimondii]|uniref:DUF4220 domain-containing protein n=1 Tax=Gossypium raimondii TaxID=29730 RepID=A0A0D2Q1Q1_GOSRA|nr:uncharacterized protein LOC105798145 [Gossypium raimondii]KJB33478.1 hypothetical protein B456_006G012700 [Gossypium raimondii]MBA0586999.1 hypothetical protein [Gossypium raimondii]